MLGPDADARANLQPASTNDRIVFVLVNASSSATVAGMLPLVERELRVALLRGNARGQWMLAAWTSAGICLLFLVVLGLASSPARGQKLFQWLFVLGCAGVVCRGVALTADLLSEERRNGTLGLLVLAGLRPVEIFMNKLLGAGLLATYALLGGLPFFAISFVTGGVSATQFLCAAAFLANGLLFCVAIGLLASVVHRNGGQAQGTAVLVMILLSLATPLMRWVTSAAAGTRALPRGWLTLSPAYPPYLIFSNFAGGSPRLFWIASGVTLIYSLAALLLAAVLMQYTWREAPEKLAPGTWHRRWQQQGRRRLRARLLKRNPFYWLAMRDRRPRLVAQVFLGTTAFLWLAGWVALGVRWLSPANAIASSIVLHLCFNVILAYAAGRRLAEERRIGAFEVLLTSPLEPAAIVEGQRRAWLVEFRPFRLIVFALDVALCVGGLAVSGWSGPDAVFYAVVYLLAWAIMLVYWFAIHSETAYDAMWISAWTGRPTEAALLSTKRTFWAFLWVGISSLLFLTVLSLVYVCFLCFLLLLHGLERWDSGVFFLALFLSLPFVLYAPVRASSGRRRALRHKLVHELRSIACEPVSLRGDKRFNQWELAVIFPSGWWGTVLRFPFDLWRAASRQGSETRTSQHSGVSNARARYHR
jgi:hypothetical protein